MAIDVLFPHLITLTLIKVKYKSEEVLSKNYWNNVSFWWQRDNQFLSFLPKWNMVLSMESIDSLVLCVTASWAGGQKENIHSCQPEPFPVSRLPHVCSVLFLFTVFHNGPFLFSTPKSLCLLCYQPKICVLLSLEVIRLTWTSGKHILDGKTVLNQELKLVF